MTADPMLPVGQKMRCKGDGRTAVVENSGTDWAQLRMEKGGLPFALFSPDGGGLWETVTEPATWDVRPSVGVLHVVPTGARGQVSAVEIRAGAVPDPIDVYDLAHCIAEVLENWDEWAVLATWVGRHRHAQTEREAS